MRCDEVRPLLLNGSSNQAAEEHVSECSRCFSWLEQHDPVVELLQRQRPASVLLPRTFTARVLTAWQRPALNWQLAPIAFSALFLIGVFALAAAGYTYPGLMLAFLAPAGWLAGIMENAIATLSVLVGLLLDNP